MLLTHATKAARGYDARTGEPLWSMGKHSEIVVPTPFVAHDLIFVASGYSPVQPIVAIRPTARGDISLPSGEKISEHIVWSTTRNGPYMPSPIVYGDYLYICSNSGVLTCYYAKTGEEVYRKRITAPGGGLAFTASPLAADGHLYFPAEDGRVVIIKAGPEYEMVSSNQSGGSILATPAISDRILFVRTNNRLMAFEGSLNGAQE
jgi:outer membrane protein assembly factor BamB